MVADSAFGCAVFRSLPASRLRFHDARSAQEARWECLVHQDLPVDGVGGQIDVAGPCRRAVIDVDAVEELDIGEGQALQ